MDTIIPIIVLLILCYNIVPVVASGRSTTQPGVQASGATPSENLIRMLTAADPQQQKQIIGEHLYRQIFTMHNDLAGKITGELAHICS